MTKFAMWIHCKNMPLILQHFCQKHGYDGFKSICYPKCEVRYGPTLAQHRQKFTVDRLPRTCHYWNDNSGIYLATNSGPDSGRQYLCSAQQRANAVPNSGFLTSRRVCRGTSETWPSNVPSMGWTLTLLLSELDAIVKMTIGLV